MVRLRRISAANVFPLTMAEVSAHMRDDLLEQAEVISGIYIPAANAKVGEMAGLILGREVWEITATDVHGDLYLPLIPVAEIISVNGGAPTGYMLDIDGDRASVAGPWPEGEVKVQFAVGGDVPPALKLAMLMLVAHWSLYREATSDETIAEIPYAVESLVSDHRRGWVGA